MHVLHRSCLHSFRLSTGIDPESSNIEGSGHGEQFSVVTTLGGRLGETREFGGGEGRRSASEGVRMGGSVILSPAEDANEEGIGFEAGIAFESETQAWALERVDEQGRTEFRRRCRNANPRDSSSADAWIRGAIRLKREDAGSSPTAAKGDSCAAMRAEDKEAWCGHVCLGRLGNHRAPFAPCFNTTTTACLFAERHWNFDDPANTKTLPGPLDSFDWPHNHPYTTASLSSLEWTPNFSHPSKLPTTFCSRSDSGHTNKARTHARIEQAARKYTFYCNDDCKRGRASATGSFLLETCLVEVRIAPTRKYSRQRTRLNDPTRVERTNPQTRTTISESLCSGGDPAIDCLDG
ncbi:hypothetical protein B0H16DRAFT_1697180 [Mycena metata]|uniref:Uncharacterized protein n=1 Tax=Mycena metata TaxID=1033252 RepID=A0AAD7MRZ6_9AGAR|nr:hypothetical protein B0H16DRAFT_1697180 [Mycena metata]